MTVMEQRIRFARAFGGASIAYWTLGEGNALIGIPTGPWGIELESRHPGYRRWYERLAQRQMVVRYDGRGCGLSSGDTDWSLAAQALDIDAVADHLGLTTFALEGPPVSGPAAIAYAAGHPERVSHLILWNSWARTADALGSPQGQALLALLDQDWEVFTETFSHMIFGWSAGAEAHELAVLFRRDVSQGVLREYIEALLEFDTTDLLPLVRAPTLVVHNRDSVLPGPDSSQKLAALIPSAHLVLLNGQSIPWLGDMEANARAHEEFLGVSETPQRTEAPAEPGHVAASEPGDAAATEPVRSTAVILFTDIVDSMGLTEQLGDAAFRSRARELDGALRSAIRKGGGTPVEGKLLGDGVLALFASAQQAIETALACAGAGNAAGLPLHLGVHAGDVIHEDDPGGRANVYGGTVNIAARVAAASQPGQILVSDTVRGLARTSAAVAFDDQGEHELKGVSGPIRIFAVRQGADAAPPRPVAPAATGSPGVEYIQTPEGVNLAVSVLGSGQPLVFVPQYPWSHIQKEWEVPILRELWTAASRRFRLIRYDARGTGLSDRGLEDLSPEAHLRDLEAVVSGLGLPKFVLAAATSAGPIGIEYAGKHPDRVSHLILWCTSSKGSDLFLPLSALSPMATQDWRFFTQAIAHYAFDWLHGEEARAWAAFLEACTDPHEWTSSMPAMRACDASAYLSRITARTLVMTRRDVPNLGSDVARALASRIRGARLVILEGSSIAPVGGDISLIDAVSEFVEEEAGPPSGTPTDRQVSLTARETEVLRLLAGGQSGKQIAAELSVSLSTAQRHIANIYSKIGVRGRVGAVAYAIACGIAPPRDS